MSSVAIVVTQPGHSPLDITSSCVYESCSFEQQMNAVAGDFSVLVRDPTRSLTFDTGWEISLEIDGVLLFAGFIRSVSMGSFAPAADTSDLSHYTLRTWTLTGTDYNILFDTRFIRNTADYTHSIPVAGGQTDGAVLRSIIDTYSDMSGYDSSGILDIATLAATAWALQQGEKIRQKFEDLTLQGGGVWYIAPNKLVVYKPYDDVVKRWGFSDNPNKTPITASPDAYQSATYGFRQVEGTEDGSFMVNDALIWGGDAFSPTGQTVFSRNQDATSEGAHNRWQVAETHFNDVQFASTAQVDLRSSLIINGIPGADTTGQQKGLKFPQWQFTFTWFSADVPLLSGVPDHIIPGDILHINLSVFSIDQLLPLRTLRISFPDAFVNDGTHLVQFDGTFGLQLSDPFTLWRYLLAAQAAANQVVNIPASVNDSSGTTVYGAQYQGTPTPVTDGVTTVFTITFGYVSSSLQVFMGTIGTPGAGLLVPGVDFTETDPSAGTFTMASAPANTKFLYALAITVPT